MGRDWSAPCWLVSLRCKGLAAVSGRPLVGVHHLAGHIAANYLADPAWEPPFLCLIVSGGHSHLVIVEDYEKFQVVARTRDDAAGEAFDKIARALGLGYPAALCWNGRQLAGIPTLCIFRGHGFRTVWIFRSAA